MLCLKFVRSDPKATKRLRQVMMSTPGTFGHTPKPIAADPRCRRVGSAGATSCARVCT